MSSNFQPCNRLYSYVCCGIPYIDRLFVFTCELLTVDSHSSFLAPKDVPGGGENRQMMGEMCQGTYKRQTNLAKDKLIPKKTN